MNRKTGVIIAVVTLIVVVSLTLFLTKLSTEKEAREELESIGEFKIWTYENYVESIGSIVDSENRYEQAKVAELSKEELYRIAEKKDRYKRTTIGDEYIEKLEKEATKNLNNALHTLLSKGSLSREQYDEIRYYADNEHYVNEENIALFSEVKERFDNADRDRRQAEREALGEVQTGYSEREVKIILGNPDDITKSTEAEFWTYDNLVLTIKNGFVYDIAYSLE